MTRLELLRLLESMTEDELEVVIAEAEREQERRHVAALRAVRMMNRLVTA